MPPKLKPGGKRFPPQSKPRTLPKQIVRDPNEDLSNLSSGLSEEAENQFELELCWCVQQLQMSLDSGKLVEKQALEVIKTMNLLKNNTVPLIRKRQAMRNTFGDYRTKMVQEEKKHGKNVSNVKFSTPKVDNKKSVFVRKAANNNVPENMDANKESDDVHIDKTNNATKVCIMSKEPSEVPFKFNFSVSESE